MKYRRTLPQFVKKTVRETGKVYYAEMRIVWDKPQYSVDMGNTWHPTAKKARLHAEAQGYVVEAYV